ncbi:hypothetical protein M406DRAFT_331983 [Cryphonectria parasitica EP155]|uniref:Uncharacterized protein n=1 Tax=Cryphonectria parasitica (strain ATCC 38755 / EP155) TaxID=660469 RepID=A0A9P4XY64_CRYP1|nr:uncharacterized protein M406DRAFT_331983 [Cryphonectria parasitica EP155]KAF3763464.1 hypothetical protein M406DRAFT_331983 [Cryphonectria parasitica EP155]
MSSAVHEPDPHIHAKPIPEQPSPSPKPNLRLESNGHLLTDRLWQICPILFANHPGTTNHRFWDGVTGLTGCQFYWTEVKSWRKRSALSSTLDHTSRLLSHPLSLRVIGAQNPHVVPPGNTMIAEPILMKLEFPLATARA